MEEIRIVRSDSKKLRIKLCEEGELQFLGEEDYAVFAVYEPKGGIIIKKELKAENQSAEGFLEIDILPEDTSSIGKSAQLRPGDIVPLKWELEVHIGASVFSPAVAENFTVIIDAVSENDELAKVQPYAE